MLLSSSIDNEDGTPAYYTKDGTLVKGPNGIVSADYRRWYSKQVYANSYPSGHSSAIWSVALFLMEVLPEKADLIMKAANQYCVGRQITRYHWNSDTIIGRLVGATIAPVIRASADYSTLFSAARAEVPSNLSPSIGVSWVDNIS